MNKWWINISMILGNLSWKLYVWKIGFAPHFRNTLYHFLLLFCFLVCLLSVSKLQAYNVRYWWWGGAVCLGNSICLSYLIESCFIGRLGSRTEEVFYHLLAFQFHLFSVSISKAWWFLICFSLLFYGPYSYHEFLLFIMY